MASADLANEKEAGVPARVPRRDCYDAIVVGSGLGGLSAGALLAGTGRSVLVAERQDVPGGYAGAFRRGPYTIDPAIHVIPEPAFVYAMLDFLGTRDRVNLLPIGETFHARYPGLELTVGLGHERLVTALAELHPAQAQGIRAVVDTAARLFQEMTSMPHQLQLGRLDDAMEQVPTLFRYRRATVEDVLDEHLSDPRLKALLATIWPYMGSPPSRFSFMAFSMVLTGCARGMFYCEGSFQRLVEALADGLELAGGELVLGAEVTGIDIEGGRARGIKIGDDRVSAPIVVSNADAYQTFERLVDPIHIPARYLRRLRRLTLSPSACSLYAATTLDLGALGATHETFIFPGWDHEEAARKASGGRLGALWLTVPTLMDPSLAPPGEHLVILNSLAAYDPGVPWADRREAYGEELVALLDDAYPGFGDSLTFCELSLPTTLEGHTLNRDGALYGWEVTPRQASSGRLAHVTPVPGLYLSGHWTQQGPGSLRALTSGDAVARLVLAESGDEDALPSFRPGYLPSLEP